MLRFSRATSVVSNILHLEYRSCSLQKDPLKTCKDLIFKPRWRFQAFPPARNCSQTAGSIETINVADDRKTLSLKWKGGESSNFHSKWLRFNCRCSKCNDTANSWIWPAYDVPLTLTIKAVSTTEDGHVHIQWNEEEHDGILPKEHLVKHSYSNENRRRLRDQAKLHFSSEMTIPELSWRDVQSSEQSFYRWLRHINDPGLCLLTDVPAEHHYARNVLSKIGCLTGTLYGEIWDVKVHRKMINSAYGRQALLFHTDLAIYEAQPGIQFLHCLRFDESLEGGETLFVDIYHIAEEFRKDFPVEFQLLTQVPFTFTRIHYDRADPVHMVLRRPLITLNDENRIISIIWHEHELGPPLVDENNVEEYYRAYQLFSRAINDFPYRREIRLRKGEMICFNNRRLAHARNAFTGEGERHLQGCYVNSDDFKSKLMYLSHKLDGGRPVCHVGNTDWT